MNTAPTLTAERTYYRFENIEEYTAPSEIVIANELPITANVICDDVPLKKLRFWPRQFLAQTTGAQTKFDWLFAIIMPLICFIFDPIVFKGGLGIDGAFLGSYKVLAYSMAAVTIASSALYLTFGEKLRSFNAAFAGLFAASGFVSLGVGIVLFPFSLIGSFLLIGLLGFTPLFSAFSMFRMSYRAMSDAEPFLEKPAAVNVLMFTAFISLVIPYVLNAEVQKFFASTIN
ncbi:MAG: hypothetical protein ACRD6X_05980 [Pyrinomonadaceae bacterium]